MFERSIKLNYIKKVKRKIWSKFFCIYLYYLCMTIIMQTVIKHKSTVSHITKQVKRFVI